MPDSFSQRLLFRPAQIADADALGATLRAADRLEMQAAVGGNPIETLREGIASSDPCWAVLGADGALISLFGVVPDVESPRSGMIWLLGSDELACNRLAVLRASRLWIAEIHERYDYVWNYVDARNRVHMNWLRWCGFGFVELLERHGVEQRPFWRVERRAEADETRAIDEGQPARLAAPRAKLIAAVVYPGRRTRSRRFQLRG